MKVVAIKEAFHNGALVKVGSTVEVDGRMKASWFIAAESEEAKAAKPKPEKQEPKALSELGKAQGQSFVEANAAKG